MVHMEIVQGNNLTRDHSKSCPADILLPNWFLGQTHLTSNHFGSRSVGQDCCSGHRGKETAGQYYPKCSELEWVCPHGGCIIWNPGVNRPLPSSPQSMCKPKSVVLNDIYGWENVELARASAMAILSRKTPLV